MPKAGTHLVERALCLHPRLYRALVPAVLDRNVAALGGFERLVDRLRPGRVLVTHLRYDPSLVQAMEQANCHSVFTIRDPKDILVSSVNYALGERYHPRHNIFAQEPTMKARLLLAIHGDPSRGVLSIRERLEYWNGWLQSGSVIVRFEDLIGSRGGGSNERQFAVLQGLYRHLGIEDDAPLVHSIGGRLYSSESRTFSRGAIGRWREVFDSELEEAYLEAVGDAAASYGYS